MAKTSTKIGKAGGSKGGFKAASKTKYTPGPAPFKHDPKVGTSKRTQIGAKFKNRTTARFGVRGGKIGPSQAGTGHAEK